jgi:hypothetical protein
MPALIPITEDVGAREEKCANCGEVIGIVDFLVRCGVYEWHGLTVEYLHLDCDQDIKRHVEELRAARKGKASEHSAKQAKTPAPKRFGRFAGYF